MRFPWQKEQDELDAELRHHMDELVAEYVAQGMTEAEARRRARREFGASTALVKDQCQDESRWAWMTGLRQDVVFGWRMIQKTPVVSLAAVLSLAIGIGSNTAIFSLMQTALFQTIAVPAPEQISLVHWQVQGRAKTKADRVFAGASGSMYPIEGGGGGMVANFFSGFGYEAVRDAAAPLGKLAAYMFPQDVSVQYQGQTQVVQARPVSGDFFDVLQLRPAMGRLFQMSDDSPGATPTVVVSHRYWRTVLASDAKAIGRSLRISNRNYELIGVLPESFGGISTGENVQAYLPLQQDPRVLEIPKEGPKFHDFQNRMHWFLQVIARRAPGVSTEALQQRLESAFPAAWERRAMKAEFTPHIRLDDGSRGLGDLRRQFQQPMYVLLGLAGIMLLIACANIANLMLARADARKKEAAIRLSLGCSQARLLRQFLTESAILAALGGVLSVVFALGTARALVTLTPSREPLVLDIGLNWELLLFTMGATVFTVALFGIFPAMRATRVDTSPALKEGGGSAGGAAHSWWTPGKLLVVAQVAFALLLAASAALFTRNLQRIISTDAGFERGNMIVFDLKPGQTGYSEAALRNFYAEVQRTIAEAQGVQSASLAEIRPMNQGGNWSSVRMAGSKGKENDTAVNRVTPEYFQTFGVTLKAGREFRRAEQVRNATVCIVSEDLAKAMGEGMSLLGKSIAFSDPNSTPMEVVGIAANLNYADLKERPNVVYLPFTAEAESATVVVRTGAAPYLVLPFVREAVRKVDANLPLVDPYTMEELVNNGLRSERMFAYLCGAFGVLAVLLASIGLYGVISYAVSRRRNEIGIRMALGATKPSVVRLVLRDGLILTSLGVLLGAPAIYYGSQFVEKTLSDMKALDPVSLVTAALTLLAAAFVAALLPSLRAAATDPVNALRQE
ncbi:hypothetical protein F183_A49710 [Bryobacterales bacterium F-183]|nr:hypothetical protein F183_A49710 [Bryobacterales bacterium F-183]